MLPYHCVDSYPVLTSTGGYQRLVVITPWLNEDIWITGWDTILFAYPTSGPRVNVTQLLGQVSEGGSWVNGVFTGDTPKFNFASFGGNGGDFSTLDQDYDFNFPSGYGIFLPGIGNANPPRAVSMFGTLPAGQSFQAFCTIRYQLASEVTNWQEPKIKTLTGSATQQVPFVVVQEPWETIPINIIGFDLGFFSLTGAAPISMHICNSASPDIVKNTGYHKRSLNWWAPSGVSVPFPASGGQYPPHVDCHIELDPNHSASHTAFMLVYYI